MGARHLFSGRSEQDVAARAARGRLGALALVLFRLVVLRRGARLMARSDSFCFGGGQCGPRHPQRAQNVEVRRAGGRAGLARRRRPRRQRAARCGECPPPRREPAPSGGHSRGGWGSPRGGGEAAGDEWGAARSAQQKDRKQQRVGPLASFRAARKASGRCCRLMACSCGAASGGRASAPADVGRTEPAAPGGGGRRA